MALAERAAWWLALGAASGAVTGSPVCACARGTAGQWFQVVPSRLVGRAVWASSFMVCPVRWGCAEVRYSSVPVRLRSRSSSPVCRPGVAARLPR